MSQFRSKPGRSNTNPYNHLLDVFRADAADSFRWWGGSTAEYIGFWRAGIDEKTPQPLKDHTIRVLDRLEYHASSGAA